MDQIFTWDLPDKTGTYTPIVNQKIHELCLKQAEANGLEIISAVANAKNRNCIVKYTMKEKGVVVPDDSGMSLMAGWKNSYDKSVSFGFGIGSVVNICTNGMVTGEFTLKRKHTGNADILVERIIKEYFESVTEVHRENIRRSRIMKDLPVSENMLNQFIGALLRDKRHIMTQAQVTRFLKECEASEHFHRIGTDENFSAWDMYNAGTEALKTSSNNVWLRKHVDFNDFVNETLSIE